MARRVTLFARGAVAEWTPQRVPRSPEPIPGAFITFEVGPITNGQSCPSPGKRDHAETTSKMRILTSGVSKTSMEMLRGQQNRLDVLEEQKTSNELVKRIRKLRWIGMEREAEGAEMQLALLRPVSLADSVFAGPHDTD